MKQTTPQRTQSASPREVARLSSAPFACQYRRRRLAPDSSSRVSNHSAGFYGWTGSCQEEFHPKRREAAPVSPVSGFWSLVARKFPHSYREPRIRLRRQVYRGLNRSLSQAGHQRPHPIPCLVPIRASHSRESCWTHADRGEQERRRGREMPGAPLSGRLVAGAGRGRKAAFTRPPQAGTRTQRRRSVAWHARSSC